MKVKELINELSNMDQESEIHFEYESNDYWRTKLAPSISSVESAYIIFSAYHNKPKIIDGASDDFDEEDEDIKSVVLLK